MSGSSRSLIRALETVLDQWNENQPNGSASRRVEDDSKDNSKDKRDFITSTPQIQELFSLITAFHQKHNTVQSISRSNSINEELFRVYNKYISSDANITKELFFLEVLKQLSPVMSEDEIMVWFQTYLKPALNSAGFDNHFVSKSRDLITQITSRIMPSDDPMLLQRREAISIRVINEILKIYIGQDKNCYALIDLSMASPDDLDNQVMCERIRFIEKNCVDLLHDYGLKHSKKFFEIIDSHFVKSRSRLKVLILLSQIIAYQTSRVHEVVHTPLFGNLLKSISYDCSKSVVLVSLSILVMTIPQICDTISEFLPDLLVIYMRIINWHELNSRFPDRVKIIRGFLDDHSIVWDLVEFDPIFNKDSNSTSYPTNSRIEFDASYLATLIYGLFPLNFTKFHHAPIEFLMNQPPKIVDTSFIINIHNKSLAFNGDGSGPHEETMESLVISKTRNLLRKFLLHPNFLNSACTAKSELDQPIAWLLDEFRDEDIVCEEITLGCLNLNPDLFINVPDDVYTLSSDVVSSKSSNALDATDSLQQQQQHRQQKQSSRRSEHDLGFVYRGTGAHLSGTHIVPRGSPGQMQNTSVIANSPATGSSGQGSRNSSTGNAMYFNVQDGLAHKVVLQRSLQNLNRKLSIIPTHLVIDDHHESASKPHNDEGLGIQFKEVKFDQGRQIGDSFDQKDQHAESSQPNISDRNQRHLDEHSGSSKTDNTSNTEINYDNEGAVNPKEQVGDNTGDNDESDVSLSTTTYDEVSSNGGDYGVSTTVKDLFNTHEKLYTPHSSYSHMHGSKTDTASDLSSSFVSSGSTTVPRPLRNASSFLNDRLRNDLHMQRPVSSPTTSVETTTIHKGLGAAKLSTSDNLNGSSISAGAGAITTGGPTTHTESAGSQMHSPLIGGIGDNSSSGIGSAQWSNRGNAIDFYQRELLLMKNELEFSSYMKHLNKFQYIRLKLRMNRMLRDSTSYVQSAQSRNALLKLQHLSDDFDSMTQNLQSLQLENNQLNIKMRNEKAELVNQLISVRTENDSLKENLSILTRESSQIEATLNQLANQILPSRDSEISQLTRKLEALQVDYQRQLDLMKEAGEQTSKPADTREQVQSVLINETEQQIYDLKNHIASLTTDNNRVSNELRNLQSMYDASVKSYESKLSNVKLEIGEHISQYATKYESKIQELTVTILKYETLLEDKNAQIVQLSTSKPISIPGSNRHGSETRKMYGSSRHPSHDNGFEAGGDFDNNFQRGSNPSLDSVSSPSTISSAPPVPSVPPTPHHMNSFRHNALGGTGSSTNNVSSTPQAAPIVRGRGGYQKRSKKHM